MALLRPAADIDDALGNDSPQVGGGVRLALAGALLDVGFLDEAAREIAEAQRLDGRTAWTHLGLVQLPSSL